MESGSKIPIFLLKTKSTPSDAYEEHFTAVENGLFQPIFVPVLEHRFNGESLKSLREQVKGGSFSNTALSQSPGQAGYGGVIFTSQRAVDAFAQVVQSVRDECGSVDELLPSELPLYAVGPATARGLRALNLQCPVLGEESGNGEALARFILEHYNHHVELKPSSEKKLPLLFLVGEQRRDIIPRTLQADNMTPSKRIEVHEVVVYESVEMQSFRDSFRSIWLESLAQSKIQWVVVFSPTGCKALLEALGIPGTQNQDNRNERTTFIVTIGPTTRDYLKRQFDFDADASAASPTPEGVLSAIKGSMGRNKAVE